MGRTPHVPQLRRNATSVPATFWTQQAYHRLRRIKATVDPDNLIRSNHPIPAAR